MDLMDVRREMMGVIARMAGGSVPNLKWFTSITMSKTATNTNKEIVQLPQCDKFILLIAIDKMPASSDPSNYIALTWGRVFMSGSALIETLDSILRPNGTYGTDPGMCSVNLSTNELSLGGQYGYFFEGTTYNIYMIEIPENS